MGICHKFASKGKGQHTQPKRKSLMRLFFCCSIRAPRAHSLTLLFYKHFIDAPPEAGTAYRTKKTTSKTRVFLLRARRSLTHLLRPVELSHILGKNILEIRPHMGGQHTEQKKNTPKAPFFLRAPLTHSLSGLSNQKHRKWKQETERA